MRPGVEASLSALANRRPILKEVWLHRVALEWLVPWLLARVDLHLHSGCLVSGRPFISEGFHCPEFHTKLCVALNLTSSVS